MTEKEQADPGLEAAAEAALEEALEVGLADWLSSQLARPAEDRVDEQVLGAIAQVAVAQQLIALGMDSDGALDLAQSLNDISMSLSADGEFQLVIGKAAEDTEVPDA